MENSGQKETYTGNIRKSLKKELDAYLGGEIKDGIRILSVGCGLAYEAKPILDIFPNAIYRGMDVDKNSLLGAKISNPEIPEDVFQIGDATKQEAFGSVPWDIILLRNPQVLGIMGAYLDKGHLPEAIYGEWLEIFNNSVNALRDDGGVLFLTVGTLDERELVVNYLRSKNIEITINEENQHKIKKAGFSDEFIIVAKKIKVKSL